MTAPYYGKRNPGGLTAASPGDTLYFQFDAFNDSGASIALTGLAVGDIECFKNGDPTARLTDSGYSLISDTGMMGNRPGLYRFRIQIYNTSDDTGFFDGGSWYQVAVDAVTIDARTVRTWAGSFEIGLQRVDVRAVLGDTGAAHLDQGRYGVISDSGRQAAVLDTGKVASAVWTSHATRALTAFAFDTGVAQTVWRQSTSSFTSDTGSVAYAQGRLMAVRTDTGAAHLDGGRLGVTATATVDTGVINNAVWNGNVSDHVADTGSFGYAQGRVLAVRNDTGAAHLDQGRFGVISDSGRMAAVLDTGKVASAVWTSHATRTLTAFQFDTGVWGSNAARTLTAFQFDTGVADTVWKYGDTGLRTVNVRSLFGDTGAAAHLGQAFAAQNTNSDTGLVANAAAIRVQTDKIQFDTGANEIQVDIRKVANVQIQGVGDTGTANTWRPV